MSDLIERVMGFLRNLRLDRAEDLAEIMLSHAEPPLVQLAPEEGAELAESLAQADRGEFAADEEVRAVWAKFGL